MSVLANAAELLKDVHASTDQILVGLSGGKDSLATLDLAVKEFGSKNTACYFMYFVKGLRCVEATIKYCERRYKVKVHYFPHWRLGRAYKFAQYMPHRAGASNWRVMKLTDVEQAARAQTGINWLAYGQRMTDSLERRAMLHKLCGIDRKAERVYPLWRWNAGQVYAYLRQKQIPLPAKLTVLKRSMSGVNFQEDTLLFIKQKYPDDYKKILEVFPYVEAKLARYALKQRDWQAKQGTSR